MTWENVLKSQYSPILDSLPTKKKKRLKKSIQAAEPTEYFGKDYTHLGELIELMGDLDLIKGDKKLNKRMKSIGEQNIDMLATSTKLRKQYEGLYRSIRTIVYPRFEEGDKNE